MICMTLINTTGDVCNAIWNEEDYKLLKSIKNSYVGNNNTPHFGAQGKYFSFKLNALYKIDQNQSSIGKYGIKKSKDKERNERIKSTSSWMEEKLINSLDHAVSSHCKMFLNCSNFMSPVMDVAGKFNISMVI